MHGITATPNKPHKLAPIIDSVAYTHTVCIQTTKEKWNLHYYERTINSIGIFVKCDQTSVDRRMRKCDDMQIRK